MRRRECGVINYFLIDFQIFFIVVRYVIYYIVMLDGGQLIVFKFRDIMFENLQFISFSIDDLLCIFGKYLEMFDLEEIDREKFQSNVVLVFELQICDQFKKCGGYLIGKDMYICKYFF